MDSFHSEVSLIEREYIRCFVFTFCKVRIKTNEKVKICECRVPTESADEVREYLLQVSQILNCKSDTPHLLTFERRRAHCILCRKFLLTCSCMSSINFKTDSCDFHTQTWRKVGLLLLEPLFSKRFPFIDFGQGIFLFSIAWCGGVRFNIVYLHPISGNLEFSTEDPVADALVQDLDESFVCVEWEGDGVPSCCFPLSHFLGSLKEGFFDVVKERFPLEVNSRLSNRCVPTLESICLNLIYLESCESNVKYCLPPLLQKNTLDQRFATVARSAVAPLLTVICRRFFPQRLNKILGDKIQAFAQKHVKCT